jgi:hypothetical protein
MIDLKPILILSILLTCWGCESTELKSHQEMIRILSEKSEMVNPEINLYANKKRLAWLQNQILMTTFLLPSNINLLSQTKC